MIIMIVVIIIHSINISINFEQKRRSPKIKRDSMNLSRKRIAHRRILRLDASNSLYPSFVVWRVYMYFGPEIETKILRWKWKWARCLYKNHRRCRCRRRLDINIVVGTIVITMPCPFPIVYILRFRAPNVTYAWFLIQHIERDICLACNSVNEQSHRTNIFLLHKTSVYMSVSVL